MAGVAAARFQTTRTMVRSAWFFRIFGTNPIAIQVRCMSCPKDAAKQEIEKLKKVTNQIKEKAVSHADYVSSQSKEATGVAKNIADKAKQSAHEAWNATKDAANKVQNTVTGETKASAAHVKNNMEAAKTSMNTKNPK